MEEHLVIASQSRPSRFQKLISDVKSIQSSELKTCLESKLLGYDLPVVLPITNKQSASRAVLYNTASSNILPVTKNSLQQLEMF